MRVLVYETNLFWSSRLLQSLRNLGHSPVLREGPVPECADAAIVNLGEASLEPAKLIAELKALGVPTIGHAGHREKDLLTLGREAGVDIAASNSELTFKLDQLLERLAGAQANPE